MHAKKLIMLKKRNNEFGYICPVCQAHFTQHSILLIHMMQNHATNCFSNNSHTSVDPVFFLPPTPPYPGRRILPNSPQAETEIVYLPPPPPYVDRRSKNLAPSQKVSRRHSYENINELRHDEYFNNILLTIKESLCSAIILRNPHLFGGVVYKLSSIMLPLVIQVEEWMNYISIKSKKNGQFASVQPEEIIPVLETSVHSPLIYAKKILLLINFGALFIDIVSRESRFFNINGRKVDLIAIREKNLNSKFFAVRGRLKTDKKHEHKNIGIMTCQTLNNYIDSLSQKYFLIPELTSYPPVMRAKINTVNGISSFVNQAVDLDFPLIGSISGSAACLKTALDILLPYYTSKQQLDLALSCSAMLVGGGYHSDVEVMSVMAPGMSMQKGIQGVMSLITDKPSSALLDLIR